ncbi:AraC family transcriptional regulator [Chitinophaga sp. MM2321]|uniref:AraC family transcriptional regulator n=1 Tax=Chitinophaga sp. MM2321 TaxID=3137178 RepID=UPI0032D598A1
MRSVVQKSTIPASRIFVAHDLREKHFDPTWHAHEEYQIFLVLKGTGTRFIGNTVTSFSPGDFTLLGPHVPHLWRSDDLYFDKQNNEYTHGLVIYFKEDFLGELLEKDEMTHIKTLFVKAQRGIEYYGKIRDLGSRQINNILAAHGMESVILLLSLLDSFAHSKDFRLLHNADYVNTLKETETHRINLVYNYVLQHFKEPIALEQVAALLHMTPTSFSRYFRIKTSKSFTGFLSELRIRHACKLLSEEDGKSIHEICYECGFNTLSNFNRQFKTFMKMPPKEYRQAFLSL